jgi:hypothetical protein
LQESNVWIAWLINLAARPFWLQLSTGYHE